MAKVWIPAGRVPTKSRDFASVVADVRHAVFSVNRQRPLENGQVQTTSLGSGFFVSPHVFVTCWHVIDSPQCPHQAGDSYRLVNNIDGTHGYVHEINGGVGVDIHLYPDDDFAIITSDQKKDQAFLPISYADVPVGSEIGVAGYPLVQLVPDTQGNLTLAGVVYKVARGVATAYYKTNLESGDGHPLLNRMVLEVNFLFVPGNSGGPIFEADTGRVVAYVKGFSATKIKENQERCALIALPEGLPQDYLNAVYAVYSNGLTLEPVRHHLEAHGVTL